MTFRNLVLQIYQFENIIRPIIYIKFVSDTSKLFGMRMLLANAKPIVFRCTIL